MEMDPSTWLISGARSRTPGEPLNVAPQFASNFYLPAERDYSRAKGTETSDAFEHLMGVLEGGHALAFGSGMAAAATVLNRLPSGATLAVPLDPYHGVKGLAEEAEDSGAMEDSATWIWPILTPGSRPALVADLRLAGDTPANPLITVADLPTICTARPARSGAIIAVDSTFATPLGAAAAGSRCRRRDAFRDQVHWRSF